MIGLCGVEVSLLMTQKDVSIDIVEQGALISSGLDAKFRAG